jgi:hypothetical protein
MCYYKSICFQAILLLTSNLGSSIASPVSPSAKSGSILQSTSHFLSSSPLEFRHGHAVLQIGGYLSSQGSDQHINIDDLIGDEFTVTHGGSSNGLVGLGYFIDGQETTRFKMAYGINAFYLPKTSVSGEVIQESLFTNLSYSYQVTHYPVYAVAKSTINTTYPRYDVTMDVGVGPNFMHVAQFDESPLDGFTLPDLIFSSHTTITFSAILGAGIKVNHFFGQAPLECGYRFFYLGHGKFNKATNQVVNNLTTGSVYANALMCSIIV